VSNFKVSTLIVSTEVVSDDTCAGSCEPLDRQAEKEITVAIRIKVLIVLVYA
jgi:hypothetical protein